MTKEAKEKNSPRKGRIPRKQPTKILNIRISEEMKQEINELAASFGMSSSEFIRARIVNDLLKGRAEETKGKPEE